tara:strand:- start:973 stop:1140 length:168 start_codon:yes stop_codon:yes gene_type:complete
LYIIPPWASIVFPLVSFQTAPGTIHDAASAPNAKLDVIKILENSIFERFLVEDQI